ncbi:metallophosphoesterase family protein [Aquimarina sp. MMG016]|uniref:metallophosphoesterase family protein n=1 Tax=Aquimarina sp. MMG016 TaxID=2822690 RepID=UPI001B39FDDD|nr:metallophosphoesterase family protein [Aquimarina sp. MMG016]MBQ4820171.1 serine/threonine protein phosphatase [Aquimarina sp. MMG016]
MSRTLVIGDIHGALKALKQLIDIAKITPDDRLIFLGDYVDGWSDSAKLVSFLIKLKTTHNCLFIRGNHDALCYDWLKQDVYNPEWIKHGGQASIDSYGQLSKEEIEAHLVFYENLTNYYIDDQNRLFLHAGFSNLHGPHREYFDETFYWDRTLWETALALNPKLEKTALEYPKRLLLFKEIYIGHTPVTRINQTKPINAACVWNIDTGAAFKGSLTMLDVDTKEFWQSDPVHTLYPNENGRN